MVKRSLKTQDISRSDPAGTAVRLSAALAFICGGLLLAVITGGLFYSAVRAGSGPVLSAFGTVWAPESGSFGILPMAAGSLLTALLATAAAIPLCFGLLSCMWLNENTVGRALRGLMRFMSGIPTVVYAFCGLFILVPVIRSAGAGAGYGILTVSVVLCLLILPTMTILADSALSRLSGGPEGLEITAAALGVSRERAFLYVVLPAGGKALISAVLLSFSRALGDTMAALMLSGNSPVFPESLTSSARTLSGHISLLTATEITPGIEFTLFLSGFLLFFMALLLSMAVMKLRSS